MLFDVQIIKKNNDLTQESPKQLLISLQQQQKKQATGVARMRCGIDYIFALLPPLCCSPLPYIHQAPLQWRHRALESYLSLWAGYIFTTPRGQVL